MSKHMRNTTQTTPRLPLASSDRYQELLVEIRDRVTRIETRTTKYFEAQGFDTGVTRAKWLGKSPGWEVARILLPGPATSVKEILAVIPANHREDVDLYVGGELIASLYK